MDTLSQFTLPTILFLVTVFFGFWVSKLGKPYNGILFNVHKLIALGTVIISVMRISNRLQMNDSQAGVIGLLILAAISVIALFASGALMSAGKLEYRLVLTVHRIAPVLLVVSLACAAYLFLSFP